VSARLRLLGVLLTAFSAFAAAQDPLAPRDNAATALVGPLEQITLIVADIAPTAKLYRDGLAMRMRGPQPLEPNVAAALGLPDTASGRVYTFDQPKTPDAAQIRVIELRAPGGLIRAERDARGHGGLSIGFPIGDLARRHAAVVDAGFALSGKLQKFQMPKADGSRYAVGEMLIEAPENLYAIGVWREPSMAPIGAIDAELGLGGPAYSGQTVEYGEAVLWFYTDVLGLEARRDFEFTSAGPDGGLKLPAGTTMRFIQLFSPGSSSGYLVLLDFRAAGQPNPLLIRAPNRGIVGYAFEVRQWDALMQRIKASATAILHPTSRLDSADLGARRSLTVLSPNGFPIELFERLPAPVNDPIKAPAPLPDRRSIAPLAASSEATALRFFDAFREGLARADWEPFFALLDPNFAFYFPEGKWRGSHTGIAKAREFFPYVSQVFGGGLHITELQRVSGGGNTFVFEFRDEGTLFGTTPYRNRVAISVDVCGAKICAYREYFGSDKKSN
jgi:catechol 2,3-dioxygenase-like lactoylglutathione lyase family enzyme